MFVKYPDCNNYESNKILVFNHPGKPIDFKGLLELDPHFCDSKKHLSPFARFEPTEKGWGAACAFIISVVNENLIF